MGSPPRPTGQRRSQDMTQRAPVLAGRASLSRAPSWGVQRSRRFGSWCYTGVRRVQPNALDQGLRACLVPSGTLPDAKNVSYGPVDHHRDTPDWPLSTFPCGQVGATVASQTAGRWTPHRRPSRTVVGPRPVHTGISTMASLACRSHAPKWTQQRPSGAHCRIESTQANRGLPGQSLTARARAVNGPGQPQSLGK